MILDRKKRPILIGNIYIKKVHSNISCNGFLPKGRRNRYIVRISQHNVAKFGENQFQNLHVEAEPIANN